MKSKKPLICVNCNHIQTILEATTSTGLSCVNCGGNVVFLKTKSIQYAIDILLTIIDEKPVPAWVNEKIKRALGFLTSVPPNKGLHADHNRQAEK